MDTREEILAYLSSFKIIAEVEFIKADTWLDSYPQLALGYANFSFQLNGKPYVFRLQANVPQKRLYYSILDQSGSYLQSFYPLANFDINLLTNKLLSNNEMYYYDSKVYFK